jgi:hypothetical protein
MLRSIAFRETTALPGAVAAILLTACGSNVTAPVPAPSVASPSPAPVATPAPGAFAYVLDPEADAVLSALPANPFGCPWTGLAANAGQVYAVAASCRTGYHGGWASFDVDPATGTLTRAPTPPVRWEPFFAVDDARLLEVGREPGGGGAIVVVAR